MAISEVGDLFAIVGAVLAALALVLLIRIQLHSHATDELRAALLTARSEIQIQRTAVNRLDAQLFDCSNRVATLEGENRVLAQTIESGLKLAPEFEVMLRKETIALHAALSDRTDEIAAVLAKKVAARAAEQDKQWQTLEEHLTIIVQSVQGQILRGQRLLADLIRGDPVRDPNPKKPEAPK